MRASWNYYICLMGGVTRVKPGAKQNFEYNILKNMWFPVELFG